MEKGRDFSAGMGFQEFDVVTIPSILFLTTIPIFLGTCMITAAARFFIRIRYQKIFSVDDALLLFGLCCMISAVGVIFAFLGTRYSVEDVDFSIDEYQNAEWALHRFSTIALVLEWGSVISVKFSFLWMFWRLIDRVPAMKRYWWMVAIFNIGVSCYCISTYFVACPYFTHANTECEDGQVSLRSFEFTLSQIILDVVGDLLILYIPIHLILRIKIRWTQKVAVSSSLCLTLIIIAISIVKVAGIRIDHVVDTHSMWEIYFQTISAEIGLIMTAVTAFRAFYVARSSKRVAGLHDPGHPATFRHKINPKNWLSMALDLTSEEEPSGPETRPSEMPGTTLTCIGGSGREETELQLPNEVARPGSISRWASDVEGNRKLPGHGDSCPLMERETPSRHAEKSTMLSRSDVSFLSQRDSSSCQSTQGSSIV